MKQKDITFIKTFLENDFFINDFIEIKKTSDTKLKIFYHDKVVTISDSIGFAYLVGWWCDGSITGTQADHFSKLCYEYNERF